jgi:hypothetical protein
MYVFITGVGGLGNSLFQLSTAIYYCEKYNYTLKILKNDTILFGTSNMFNKTKSLKRNDKYIGYNETIFNKLEFIENIDTEYLVVHNDYTNDIIDPNNNNILISGHNQNIDLFRSVMNKIPNYLHFDDIHIKNYILEKYPGIENSTILCIRIGDDFKYMTKITPDSYLKSLSYLKTNNEIIDDLFIISDIPVNCFLNNTIPYFKEINEPDIFQMYAGLLCKNIVLSESTFHLWIAYFATNFGENTNKKVICFNNTDITDKQLDLDNWIKINV